MRRRPRAPCRVKTANTINLHLQRLMRFRSRSKVKRVGIVAALIGVDAKMGDGFVLAGGSSRPNKKVRYTMGELTAQVLLEQIEESGRHAAKKRLGNGDYVVVVADGVYLWNAG